MRFLLKDARSLVRLVPALLVLLGFVGCRDDAAETAKMLVAKQIESGDELIGGPSAKGKIGDFLLANDKVRFIIAGNGQAWAGGVFGGSLLDADLQRKRSDTRYGRGWDSFAETFPLVNLVVANTSMDGQKIGFDDNGVKMIPITSGIEIMSDGSDGTAWVRVSGRVGYMFEAFKFLNKDFLRGFLAEPMEIMGMKLPIDELLNMFLGVNVYALLNRLQTDFYFHNDYLLHEGESYLTIRTTIITSPPSEANMARCEEVVGCELQCEFGYALKEMEYDIPGQGTKTPGKVMCPICECAEETSNMLSLNESEDIFQIFLGDLEPWRSPDWKGGLLGGDFLFFGSEANIFSPGIGFDEGRKIFENMWQKVPTLASPLLYDWLTAVSNNVSYGWVTVNPDRKTEAQCPQHRIDLIRVDEKLEDDVVDILVTDLGFSQDEAESRVRQVIVDRRPLPLVSYDTAAVSGSYDAFKSQLLAKAVVGDRILPEEGEDADTRSIVSLFPKKGVELAVVPGTACRASKLLIPLFSTSATAVMTHKSPSSLELDENGVPVDNRRTFTFERYLVVGEGDVASVMDTIYQMKSIPTGTVSGVVVSEKSGAPVTHASVFAIKDPGEGYEIKTYEDLVAANQIVYGNDGFESQFQTDVGLDPVADGNYQGSLAVGKYYLVAFQKNRNVSLPTPVTVAEGGFEVVHLVLPGEGRLEYVVQDQSGQTIPCRLSFIALNDDGTEMDWEGKNNVALGGSRYDHGIYYNEHSTDGTGEVALPPGKYDVYVSRGFEYGIDVQEVEIRGGQTQTFQSVLLKEVDTRGYISGDFHIHSRESIDSAMPKELRVTAAAAEGVEFFVATDHDVLTYYQPYVNVENLRKFVKTDVGLETTTFEFGHYNGFPMEYKDTDIPVHNPVPWFGYNVDKVWSMMRDRVQEGFSRDEFIIQLNHARDGFMGYFSQLGLHGYDLERSTGGMEMCNPQTVHIPCDFDSIELFNEKRYELFRTPTIAEKVMHNECFGAILDARIGDSFTVEDAGAGDVVCENLQGAPYDDCDTLDATINAYKGQDDMALARLYSRRDHCRWHDIFSAQMARCTEDVPLLKKKRIALEALKLLSVRYEMERMPDEQAAFFATTEETDLGCDGEKAMAGCNAAVDDAGEAILDGEGTPLVGCENQEDCYCFGCVTANHPECDAAQEGGAWTQDCADLCASECYGCGVQPCTDKSAIVDDWFSFLNYGLVVTGVGNSDSHDVAAEMGLPRNYIVSSTDDPFNIDPREIYRNYKARRLTVSLGPFLTFEIEDGTIGDEVSALGKDKLKMHIKVQTASWFGVDHIEIYRNAQLEKIIRIEPAPEAIVDFDETIELDTPDVDSWYVVMAYGLDGKYLLSPVYKRMPLGKMLIPTIIAMGAQAILVSFQNVINEVENLVGPELIDGLLGGLLGTQELPDSFPMFPLAVTNPIWVDVDGGGFEPINAVDRNNDGRWDLPPFCSQACQVDMVTDEEGGESIGQSTCGLNQVCIPDAEGADTGMCGIPIPENCVGAQVDVEE